MIASGSPSPSGSIFFLPFCYLPECSIYIYGLYNFEVCGRFIFLVGFFDIWWVGIFRFADWKVLNWWKFRFQMWREMWHNVESRFVWWSLWWPLGNRIWGVFFLWRHFCGDAIRDIALGHTVRLVLGYVEHRVNMMMVGLHWTACRFRVGEKSKS